MKPPVPVRVRSSSRSTGKFTLVGNLQEGTEEPEPLSPIVLSSASDTKKMRGCVLGSALPLRLNCLKYQTK